MRASRRFPRLTGRRVADAAASVTSGEVPHVQWFYDASVFVTLPLFARAVTVLPEPGAATSMLPDWASKVSEVPRRLRPVP